MYSEGRFWLPCLVTIAVILLSFVFRKLLILMKWGIGSATAASAGNISSASASASASPSGGEYEVFLSFRGEDTRKGFTDFLYTYLVDAGIRTFRDNNKLPVGGEIGPELVKAIKESKISIPIFSQNYASSKWCLRELQQMVECHTNLGQMIFPIFYDIEPSNVRNQRGSYEKAFRRHKNLDKEMVQGWKEALRKVGGFKGLELNKETDGHEGELVKKVVEMVLLELKKNYTVLPDNLVGIDDHREEMRKLLNVDSNDVLIVGIYGMGGIGKTTIAKDIYNQLCGRFEGCCFLENVRETSRQHNGFVNLQIQLISKILKGKCPNILDDNDGLNTIKNTVCRKKVFIVLDDVDDKYQFDKLAGKCSWFGAGSRIIVTTRNEEVLQSLQVHRSYEAPLMKPDDSLQLFCKYAFMRDSPREGFNNLSEKAVLAAARLPLALVVIGSLLFGKGKEEWEDILTKLKDIPDKKIQEKLRISFEALDHLQKNIFLDIACLFIGRDKTYPFYMWNDCNFHPTNGINVLVRMSLLKVGDDNRLQMHDQLRDLGRHIDREENFNEVGERRRLWPHEEALDTLERRGGTEKVVALRLDLESRDYCFTNEEFGHLPNLRFLRVDYANLAGDFERLLSKLRWLQWRWCPENSLSNFHLKNLVILDLSNSCITHDWETWSQIKMAKKLKVLNLSNCRGLKITPDFSTFATLERLILRKCIGLEQIDPSIGNLKNLRLLDIRHCMGLTKLPDAIGNLEKLEELNASVCHKLEGEIPSNFGRLSFLRILRLDYTTIRSLPTSICGLSHLQTLDLLNCKELQSLPELPLSLTSLQVSSTSMETLPSLSNLINLKKLLIVKCLNLMEIPGDIGKLSELETLHLSQTNIKSLPAEISALSRLKQLKVRDCHNLQCILGLPSSLFKLCLHGCIQLERLPDLSSLTYLSELILYHNNELMEFQGLGKLESLTTLDVSGYFNLLKLDGLDRLESLRYLKISNCYSLEGLPDLSNLNKLQRLETNNSLKLIEIQGLDRLESLELLDISGCISIERLPNLSNLRMLKELKLWECRKLAEVEGLRVLESLERLDMTRCISLEGLLDVSNLKNLKELTIRGCENITDIRGLEELKSLEFLDIAGCKLIEKLPDLSSLKDLRKLEVFRCEKLTEIRGLEELKSLELLDISGCKSIENLPHLSNTSILRDSEESRSWKNP